MNLKCSIKSNWGRTQWAEGYQLQIGLDGIARNVPLEAARKLLSNPAVWSVESGALAPVRGLQHLPGVAQPRTVLGRIHPLAEPPSPVTVTVEVPLVPQSLELLERQPIEILEALAAEFGVSAGSDVPSAARAILAGADEQLSMQLAQLVESVAARAEKAESSPTREDFGAEPVEGGETEAAPSPDAPVSVPGPDVTMTASAAIAANPPAAKSTGRKASPANGKAKKNTSTKAESPPTAPPVPPELAPEATQDDLIG